MILVVGGGAVGTFLGATLAAAGEDVCLLRRRAPVGPTRTALTIRGPAGQRTAGVGIAGSVDAVAGTPSLIILAVKMTDLPGAIETAARWPESNVLAIENGVGADELLAERRATGGLIAGSLTAPIGLETGGEVVHRFGRGGLGLAAVRGDVGGTIDSLAARFEAGGLRAVHLPDAPSMRWSKLLANMLGNATSAILDSEPAAIYGDRRLFELERRALREALGVMHALGLRPIALPGADTRLLRAAIRLPASVVRPVMRRFVGAGRGGKTPSLQTDVRAGRGSTEAAWLNGGVDRAAATMGRRASVNARLAELVDECARDDDRRAWFRGRPDRLLAELPQS